MNIYVIRSFLQVGFRFQHQLINLAWLSVDFLHLAEANLVPRANLKKYKSIFSFPIIAKIHAGVKVELKPHIYFSVALHSRVCRCPKMSRNVLLKKTFFSAHFPINLFYLHNLKT